MMPTTFHAVVGTSHSIIFGRHFFSTSTIRRSVFGLVHTFILGLLITNTVHADATKSLFRQIMALWYRHYVIHGRFEGKHFNIFCYAR